MQHEVSTSYGKLRGKRAAGTSRFWACRMRSRRSARCDSWRPSAPRRGPASAMRSRSAPARRKICSSLPASRPRARERGLPLSQRVHAGRRRRAPAGAVLDPRRRLQPRRRRAAFVQRRAARGARRRRGRDDQLSPRRARLPVPAASTAASAGAPRATQGSSIRSQRCAGCATTSQRSAAIRRRSRSSASPRAPSPCARCSRCPERAVCSARRSRRAEPRIASATPTTAARPRRATCERSASRTPIRASCAASPVDGLLRAQGQRGPLSPVVDGRNAAAAADLPRCARASRATIPLMVGTNRDETSCTSRCRAPPIDDAELERQVREQLPRSAADRASERDRGLPRVARGARGCLHATTTSPTPWSRRRASASRRRGCAKRRSRISRARSCISSTGSRRRGAARSAPVTASRCRSCSARSARPATTRFTGAGAEADQLSRADDGRVARVREARRSEPSRHRSLAGVPTRRAPDDDLRPQLRRAAPRRSKKNAPSGTRCSVRFELGLFPPGEERRHDRG